MTNTPGIGKVHHQDPPNPPARGPMASRPPARTTVAQPAVGTDGVARTAFQLPAAPPPSTTGAGAVPPTQTVQDTGGTVNQGGVTVPASEQDTLPGVTQKTPPPSATAADPPGPYPWLSYPDVGAGNTFTDPTTGLPVEEITAPTTQSPTGYYVGLLPGYTNYEQMIADYQARAGKG